MSFGSNRQADRTNRTVLTLLGVVLVGLAAAGLIASTVASDDDTIISDEWRRWLLDHGTLMAIIGVVAAVVVLSLALLWLRHQLRPIPETHDTIVSRSENGCTILRSAALTDAVEQELRDLDGVSAATARIRAHDPDTIDVLLDVDDSTSLTGVSRQLETRILPRARRATNNDTLRFDVECRPGQGAPPSRVA
jgi:hypothetical protein